MYICRMAYTLSEENYLKVIYHLQQGKPGGASTNEIAEKMQTKASSVTDMVKKLASKGMVDYIKYQGVTLTESGSAHALRVIRKHRLWEVFLAEKLDFPWDQVHDIAEQLEHVQSPELVRRLDAFLGEPKFDPHGDPIPDAEGRIRSKRQQLLSKCINGQTAICVGVKESSSDFLRFLDQKHITIGTTLHVEGREPFDGSMTISIDGQSQYISEKIANNIYVQTDQ